MSSISRPPKKLASIPPIRCDEELLRALDTLARLSGRSFSDYVRRALEQHVWERQVSVRDEWAPSQFGRDQL